jgi:acetyltransferase-like isoleucine patch superfamily enzyme
MKLLIKWLSQIYFLFDRYILCKGDVINYYQKIGMTIGLNCCIYSSVNIGSEPWLINIGNDVTISQGASLVTHDGGTRLFRKDNSLMNPKFGNIYGRIIIKDNSFIGTNAVILPNIIIGPNSIVGAGSVVTKNVPPNVVVVGNPARILCTLSEYKEKAIKKMISIDASNKEQLRIELISKLIEEN